LGGDFLRISLPSFVSLMRYYIRSAVFFQSREARALGDLTLQPCQPLPGILNLRNTRISVFPENNDNQRKKLFSLGTPRKNIRLRTISDSSERQIDTNLFTQKLI